MKTPDNKVVVVGAPYNLPPEVVEMAKKMEEKTANILNVPLSPNDELPEVTEKQLDHAEVLALRDEIRSRPDESAYCS